MDHIGKHMRIVDHYKPSTTNSWSPPAKPLTQYLPD